MEKEVTLLIDLAGGARASSAPTSPPSLPLPAGARATAENLTRVGDLEGLVEGFCDGRGAEAAPVVAAAAATAFPAIRGGDLLLFRGTLDTEEEEEEVVPAPLKASPAAVVVVVVVVALPRERLLEPSPVPPLPGAVLVLLGRAPLFFCFEEGRFAVGFTFPQPSHARAKARFCKVQTGQAQGLGGFSAPQVWHALAVAPFSKVHAPQAQGSSEDDEDDDDDNEASPEGAAPALAPPTPTVAETEAAIGRMGGIGFGLGW